MALTRNGLRERFVAARRAPELQRGIPARHSCGRGLRPRLQPNRRLGHPRSRLLALLGSALGLAFVGAAGGALGGWLLRDTIKANGPLPVAFQAAVGSVPVVFAILGTRGHVVFGDLVGDCRERRRRQRPTIWMKLIETAVEFVGGAAWGAVCGLLIGVLAGAARACTGGDVSGPVVISAAASLGGAAAGLGLQAVAGMVRHSKPA
jgi:hypothetical protein